MHDQGVDLRAHQQSKGSNWHGISGRADVVGRTWVGEAALEGRHPLAQVLGPLPIIILVHYSDEVVIASFVARKFAHVVC